MFGRAPEYVKKVFSGVITIGNKFNISMMSSSGLTLSKLVGIYVEEAAVQTITSVHQSSFCQPIPADCLPHLFKNAKSVLRLPEEASRIQNAPLKAHCNFTGRPVSSVSPT